MNNNIISNFYKNKKIFITGHTGFKGSWLSIWLNLIGAKVYGYSLASNTNPSNFVITNLQNKIEGNFGDIRDYKLFEETIVNIQPEIIFHLAAQPC